jgi:ribosomal protein S18 acetylase RimI-like enzyme
MRSISPLVDEDVEALCALAREIWRHHYPPIIGSAQTEYMLAQRYEPAAVREDLGREDVWWDVVREEDRLLAFASCLTSEAEGEIKIDKLYVHPERQRQGLARALIDHIAERARARGYTTLSLAVNKHNANAIAAYCKHGFTVREAIVKDIGGGFVMDDYIMEKRL